MGNKRSRFNFSYMRDDGTYVVYNTYSKALVGLSEEEFKQYQALAFEDAQVEQGLMDNGILVEECFDE